MKACSCLFNLICSSFIEKSHNATLSEKSRALLASRRNVGEKRTMSLHLPLPDLIIHLHAPMLDNKARFSPCRKRSAAFFKFYITLGVTVELLKYTREKLG